MTTTIPASTPACCWIKWGLRTRWVLSGAEAVKVVQESHVSGDGYDVCFIDWKMPDMDGMETVRRIRNEVGPETLIIIISAYDWGAIEEKARAIGVNGFIAKPFFASNLYNTLTSLTRRTAPKREIEVSAPRNQRRKLHISIMTLRGSIYCWLKTMNSTVKSPRSFLK